MDIKPDPRTPSWEYIYVTVRVRPLSKIEEKSGDKIAWNCVDNHILLRDRNQGTDTYEFARAFGPTCSIQKVYDEGAKSIALSTLVGVNAIIFACGQTGSGKTFTMNGITENAVKDIFEHINLNLGRYFVVKFSALEITNEDDVLDLLNRGSGPLGLLEALEIVEERVKNIDHVTRLIGNCEAQGQVGETATSSSSSHKILRLTVESRPRENLGHTKPFIASLYLVDLAESVPASHINVTLRTVIQKLRLQSFRTAMICAISPDSSQVEQSRSTLSFATSAREFISGPKLNEYKRPQIEHDVYLPPNIWSIIYRLFHGSNSVYSYSTCINWLYPFEKLHIGSGLPPLNSKWEQKSPLLFYFSSGTKWRFLHPLTGDIYETNFPFLANATFRCSKFGWVLMSRDPGSLFFFNPFLNTTRTIDLPGCKHTLIFESSTFTAPPTSPTCKVIIIGTANNRLTRLIVCTCSRGESNWNQQIVTPGLGLPQGLELPFPVAECNPIFYAAGMYYQLGARGDLAIFESGPDGRIILTVLPTPVALEAAFNKRLYIGAHEGKILMVSVGHLDGTPPQVFELIWTYFWEWKPVDTIGKMTMFLSKDGTVLVSAKADDIDDRLYFMKIRKRYRTTYIFDEIVFYSLKDEKYYYHCYNKDFPCVDLSEVEEAGFSRSTWIEPDNSERLDQDGMFDWSILPAGRAAEEEEEEDEEDDEDEDEEDEEEDEDEDENE